VGLDSGKQLPDGRQVIRGAYGWILTDCILTVFRCVPMNVKNDRVGTRNIMVDVGNDGIGNRGTVRNASNNRVGFRNVRMVIGMCFDLNFCLEVKGQQRSYGSGRTHVKDVKNLDEVQPPGIDRVVVVLLVKTSRDRISFTPLHDVPLDLCYSPAIESLVGGSSDIGIAGSTHITYCSTALRTD
jgi:hypothetical protein